MQLETQGLEDLILTFFKFIAEFDFKSVNFDALAVLLTKFAPLWNPIWVWVTNLLEAWGIM